jgi:hypothetical protein
MNNYQTTEIEFSVVEVATAAIDIRLLTGEGYTGPMHIGYYKEDDDPGLWIRLEGERVQFVASALPAVIKQLRRAAKLAREGKSHE